MTKPIRFVHISDTHIGPIKDFIWSGAKPYPCAEKLVSHLNSLVDKPDFILHTGDVTAWKATDEEYACARTILSKLNYPVYYAAGNHDSSSQIKKYLKQGKRTDLVADKSKNTYYFDKETIRFIVLDGRGPDEIDPHGSLSEDQFEALEKQLTSSDKKIIVLIHYPPIKLDSAWLNRDMLLLEGERLHSLFAKHSGKIVCVLFGHIHRGLQLVKDNIFYSSVGSSYVQFQSYPSEEEPIFESTGQAYFNYVTIKDNQIMIKEYSISNGNEIFVKTKKELGL